MARAAGCGGDGQGLTAAEATRRLGVDGPNELPRARERTILRQAWEVVRQPMLLLLLGAGMVMLGGISTPIAPEPQAAYEHAPTDRQDWMFGFV